MFPDAVTVPEDEDEYWTVGYGRITPLIVKAVQDLKRENDRLRTEVTTVTETLRAELKAANDNFRSLKAEIDGLRRTLGR